MRESRLTVRVVWTSKLSWSNLWGKISQSFFSVRKAALPSSLSSNPQLWELSKTGTWSFTKDFQSSYALDVIAKPKLLWMSRTMEPWACVSWCIYYVDLRPWQFLASAKCFFTFNASSSLCHGSRMSFGRIFKNIQVSFVSCSASIESSLELSGLNASCFSFIFEAKVVKRPCRPQIHTSEWWWKERGHKHTLRLVSLECLLYHLPPTHATCCFCDSNPDSVNWIDHWSMINL